MSYSFKEKLIWLQGKKVAVCEPDAGRFEEIKSFLERYGIEVTALNSAEAMSHDLEQRRYATHRVFFAVFINEDLAEQMKDAWQDVILVNPKLAKTPLILMASEQAADLTASLMKTGFFKYYLTYTISPNSLLRVLRRLNRWHAIKGDISPAATLNPKQGEE